MALDERLAERVRALLSTRHGVAERLMMGGLAFLVDGSMCCSVHAASLLVRVLPAERERLLELPHVKPMRLGARTMRGFVRVDAEGVRTKAGLVKWLERGLKAGAELR